jgi:hypothetical protein
VVDLIKSSCCIPEKGMHRATIFVLDTPKFEQV